VKLFIILDVKTKTLLTRLSEIIVQYSL